MNARWIPTLLIFLSLAASSRLPAAEISRPRVLDPRLELSLIASEPDLVTPVGIACDALGRVYVLESHTHFPPADYEGPKTDRIKVFDPAPADGAASRFRVFAEGFRFGMNLAFGPAGALYLSHRNGVLRLADLDGDGKCDQRETILTLETAGNYPHNGLGGLAFSPDGWLYVGMGENLGERYSLKGSDGATHRGGGEGGNIFRCRPDGSQLQHFATGFWNPFGLAFFQHDYLLAVDNDPDSRPPNRLLDVVRYGDYGFKFRYGRSGLHPFTAWNGELPGTLGMVSDVGEAASGLLPGSSARLPPVYQDSVLATSWGDHRIDVLHPQPLGASLRADRRAVILGDEMFRPVALAAAPDGAVFFTDWVDVSYTLHGKGRLWRLRTRPGEEAVGPAPAKPGELLPERREMKELLREDAETELDQLLKALQHPDPFVRTAALGQLAHPDLQDTLLVELNSANANIRLGMLLALRRSGFTNLTDILPKLLGDADARIRLMAVIWTGEQKVSGMSNALSTALTAGPVSAQLLRAHAATSQLISGGGAGAGSDFGNRSRILELAGPRDDALLIARLAVRGAEGNLAVRQDAVWSLAGSTQPAVIAALRQVAENRANAPSLRACAITALAHAPAESEATLVGLLEDPEPAVRLEAVRSLRSVALQPTVRASLEARLKRAQASGREPEMVEELMFVLAPPGTGSARRPGKETEWLQQLPPDGDPESGRRVFFQPSVGCARCHRIEDHGGQIGPDLSTVAIGSSREKIMQSILTPSREIAPQFATHVIETRDGESFSGLLLGQDADGSATLVMADGKAVVIPGAKVKSNVPTTVSLMPAGLVDNLSVRDFRDLIAFLGSRK